MPPYRNNHLQAGNQHVTHFPYIEDSFYEQAPTMYNAAKEGTMNVTTASLDIALEDMDISQANDDSMSIVPVANPDIAFEYADFPLFSNEFMTTVPVANPDIVFEYADFPLFSNEFMTTVPVTNPGIAFECADFSRFSHEIMGIVPGTNVDIDMKYMNISPFSNGIMNIVPVTHVDNVLPDLGSSQVDNELDSNVTSTNPAAATPQPLTEFTIFGKFPPELREMILKINLPGPCVLQLTHNVCKKGRSTFLEIYFAIAYTDTYTKADFREKRGYNLRASCQEAYAIWRKANPLWLPVTKSERRLLGWNSTFHFSEQDLIYIPSVYMSRIARPRTYEALANEPCFKHVTQMAFDFNSFMKELNESTFAMRFFQAFPAMKTIKLINHGLKVGGATLYDYNSLQRVDPGTAEEENWDDGDVEAQLRQDIADMQAKLLMDPYVLDNGLTVPAMILL